MTLDDTVLNIDMPVYDIALGAGVIRSITSGQGVSVKFPSGFEAAYDMLGKGQFTNRTLYVVPPDIFYGIKDSTKRLLFSRLARAAHTELAQ